MARYLIAPLALAVVLGTAAGTAAQQPSLELRAGIVVSSALVDDAVGDPLLAVKLGLDPESVGRVRMRPSPSPMVALAAILPLRPRLEAEAEAGWTFASVQGDDGLQEWDAQDMGIGHATLALRYRLGGSAHLRGGLGIVRLSGDEHGLLEAGAVTEPLVEAGVGWSREVGPGRLGVDLLGQAHSFGTPAMRRLGGFDGTVYRLALRGGFALGGGQP